MQTRQKDGLLLEQVVHPESQDARLVVVGLTVARTYPIEYWEAKLVQKEAVLQVAQ